MRTPGQPVPRKSCGGKRKSASSVRHSNANGVDDAPANMCTLSHRSALTICDSVSVSRRFGGQSRCSAVAVDGTAWTGETDGTIAIRLVPSGMEVRRIAPIGRAAVLVMQNVSGNMWAGYSDGAIRVFDHVTQKVLRQSTQHTAAVYAMCAADGYVFTGGADGKVYQWMAEDLHYSHMYYGHRNAVRSLTTYTDQKSRCRYVVSGSDDGTVKVWEATVAKTSGTPRKDGGCVSTLDGQGRCVLSILVLEDTAELWAGSEDSAIRVWDLSSMTVTTVITGHRAPVVTLLKVGDTVWSGSKDGAITITNRFSKDIVHQASQPPARRSAAAGGKRSSVSILPVTRTVVYEVWVTAVDGSWQCWNFTVPEGVKSCIEEADVLKGGRCPSHSRPQRLSRVNQCRSRNVRSGSVSAYSENGSDSASARAHSSDEKLRASVAQTRRTVAVLLAGSKVHHGLGAHNGNGFAHRSEAVSVGIVDDDDTPLDIVAESIRNDHTAETKREVQLKQAALAKERRKSAELRAALEMMCKDPVAIAEEGAEKVFRRTDSLVIADAQAETIAMERQSGMLGSPTTEKLVWVSSQLELVKAQNEAMAAAMTEFKKAPV
ncbi:conserved hypothetical protein [Leishmania infantum JPCM5]|uniref:WD_domain_-_G-beta_repeat_-_putative n=2 Tax=Leishmania infantum TaxID=5671 RepID=A0A6L0XEE4_LEIIN|nr:conserved hypothetical protein [Leishmania infantum JPCM5]CAC9486349.1 WD_domain_-_G-beta_repeat_-_putative [Leishmania infantum]CAM67832.1 conserved hypothetical protein [Leishmania infantum JPCM5]SUZ41606.1 WD_domain_-_G-beta_repeat_-_putative [Leishmania infantum]|eukprot:XP_001465411.1 conserved hypothetical protein [Leishmania infantum JPCM5]